MNRSDVCGRAASRPAARAVLALALAWSVACGPRVTLDNTLASPEAVAQAVVDRLDEQDATGLRALAVSEREFRELVWPRLPTSRPGRNIPWDYAWKDLHSKSQFQLRGRLGEWRTRGFRVVSVRFTGETTDYDAFRVHRRSLLVLRDRNGQETTGRVFGSLIEQDGRYKVFSYVVD